MKKTLKNIVARIAWRYVYKLRKQHDYIVIGVAGSIGKTGTKRAIAKVLQQKYRVQWQDGNYNDIVSVPLVFFGLSMPSLFNPWAWLKTFRKMSKGIDDFDYDVVVLELGTDGPGQLAQFGKFIMLDLAVVTKLAPEHMEFFEDMQAVAQEELSVQSFAKELIVHEHIPRDFGKLLNSRGQTYGNSTKADVHFVYKPPLLVISCKDGNITCQPQLIGEHQMWSLTASTAVGRHFKMDLSMIQKGLEEIIPMPGRMHLLEGLRGATIVDDTYNASPDAVKAALDTLMLMPATKRIAVLGNMNELGAISKDAHKQIGRYVDAKLNCLITIGPEANTYLADTAEESGLCVMRFESPKRVGEKLSQILEEGTVVLLKGSQNGVFLEEAIKPILLHQTDEAQLVRQSSDWMKRKASLLED